MTGEFLLDKNEEIFERFYYYIKNECNESLKAEDDTYLRTRCHEGLESISNLIYKIYTKGYGVKEYKSVFKEEFQELCKAGISILIDKKSTVDLREILTVVHCYRNAYLYVILKDLDNREDERLGIYNFFVDFFDELECACGESWSKTAESEIKFKALTEIDSVFVFMYNDKQCVYLNSAAEKFIGYSKEEMRNTNFTHLFPEKYRKILFRKNKNINNNVDKCTSEVEIITKNGEKKWIEFSSGIIRISQKPLMIGIAFDINKRKKAEEDLKKSENRHKKLLEFMPDAVLVHQDRSVKYCNKSFAKLLGYEDTMEILGKAIYELVDVHDQYKAIYQQRMDRVIREGAVSSTEEKFIRKHDGKLMEIETACTLIPYKDGSAIMEIMRDVSERKRINELKQKIKQKTMLLRESKEYDKMRNEFLANISHELKTPVNVIFAAIQVMELNNKENNKSYYNKEKYLSTMKQNCYRLIRIVNNLIDITKIDAGYYEIHMCNCNIVNVVENITLSVADYIEKHDIKLTFDTDVEEKMTYCDPDKIERIMLNLLSNAIKFTEPGGEIYVNLTDLEDAINISVIDTGIGIPKEKQKDVFNRFIQVDKSLSRNHEGSGIGLSLVKSLVELHGGNIYLKSNPGEGCEFTIHLPIKKNLKEGKCICEKAPTVYNNNIERINIEFSDIYNNNNN